MSRTLLALLCLCAAGTAGAQEERFIAPTGNAIVASSEVSQGPEQRTNFFVANYSTVPIIVYGLTLTNCENTKQWCGGQRVNVPIGPGERQMIGHVEPKYSERAWSYRWSFVYRADSSDAKIVELMRRNGFGGAEPPAAAVRIGKPVAIDTSSPPGIDQPLSRAPLTEEERTGRAPGSTAIDTVAPKPFRFKVFYGSVLGSTMMPGAPIQLAGPCINPAESAKYEKDAKITRTPWRPAVPPRSLSRISIPYAMRDSITAGDALVRWVTDTTGEALPGSVSVLESPDGRMSVRLCTLVISSRSTPARDKAGRPILAWTQMPVRVER